MPKRRASYFFDTVTLSNFAFADRLDLLTARYGQKLTITREVYNELAEGIVAGYEPLRKIEALVSNRAVSLFTLKESGKEHAAFLSLLLTLSSGEASCIAAAMNRGGVVVTDDRAARSICAERDVKVTGTIGILLALCKSKTLTPTEADAILERMVHHGYRSPVKNISGINIAVTASRAGPR
jgi:predicted nucleic acid-binding protein